MKLGKAIEILEAKVIVEIGGMVDIVIRGVMVTAIKVEMEIVVDKTVTEETANIETSEKIKIKTGIVDAFSHKQEQTGRV